MFSGKKDQEEDLRENNWMHSLYGLGYVAAFNSFIHLGYLSLVALKRLGYIL